MEIKSAIIMLIAVLAFKSLTLGENPTVDTIRVMQLCDSCWLNRFSHPDKALTFGLKALELAKQAGFIKGIAQAYNDLGILYIDQSDYTKALESFTFSLEIRKEQNDSTGIAASFNKMGIVFQKQGKLQQALEMQMNALQIYEQSGHVSNQSICLNNMAIIHQNLGDLEKSLDYHQKALDLRISSGDGMGEGHSYLNMANVFLKMSDTAMSVSFYEKALQLFRHYNNDEAQSACLNNLGKLYLARGDFEKAFLFLEEALQIRQKGEDKKAMASTYAKLGQAYMGLNEPTLAKSMLLQAAHLAEESGVLDEKLEALKSLGELYARLFQFDSAYYYGENYRLWMDSVYSTRLNEQIVEAQIKFDSERQLNENQLLTRENQLFESQLLQRRTEIWLLISMVISVVGAAIFFYYRYRQRQQELHAMAMVKLNESRLAAVIEAQESERRRIARDLHDGVGQKLAGMRLLWEANRDNESVNTAEQFLSIKKLMDQSVQEVRSISHQMMPKELEQFGLVAAIDQMLSEGIVKDTICWNFEHLNLTPRLNSAIELALFRITQELVSNIIKHANAKQVNVQLLKTNDHVVLMVSDDGKGMTPDSDKTRGIGMVNIESRATSLGGKVYVETALGKGTVITIRIPL